MARLDRRSRYFNAEIVDYKIFPEEETDPKSYTRIDRVISGRFTSWEEVDGSFTYVVRVGDTFQSLAQRFYRDARLWYVLADFNFEVAFDPLELVPKTVLIIPPISFVGLVQSQL